MTLQRSTTGLLAACLMMMLAGLAGAALAAGPAAKPGKATGRALEGQVSVVIDGDTLMLAPADGSPPFELRLYEIDAPEICQEWGEEARRYLAEQVLKQAVKVLPAPGSAGHDSSGRTVGTLFVADANINIRMVEEGHAWSVRTPGGRGPLLKQETMARALRRGLHQIGSAAVPPWDFRRSHGPCPAKPVAASAPVKK